MRASNACLLLLLALLMLATTHVRATTPNEEAVVDVAAVHDMLSLGNRLVFMADPDQRLDAAIIAAQRADLPWQHSAEAVPNLGLNAPPHWFAIRLGNSSTQDWNGLLEMSYPMIDVLDVYRVHAHRVTLIAQLGDQRPFHNRLLSHRHFLIPVTIPAGDSVQLILWTESSGALKLPLDLWRMPAFFAHDQRTLAPQILFAGVMLALVMYNFFLLLATRDWDYGWYVLSMVSISFVVMSFHGILAQYVWPETPALNNPVLVASISTNIFAATVLHTGFWG